MRLRPPPERSRRALGLTLLAAAGLVVVASARSRRGALPSPQRRRPPEHAAGQVRNGAALLAGSVLIDSATEHYRGDYHHKAMYVAPAAAGAALAAAVAAPHAARPAQRSAFVAAAVAGLAGHLFHARNIARRPGAPSWETLFYAAPIGAPGALALAGLAGIAALRLEATRPHGPAAGRAGRGLAVGTVLGLLGTTAEVALLHFRGAFHNPAMYIPVTLPPVAALVLAEAAARPTPRSVRSAKAMLRATAAMGLVGTAFHAWGVKRNMGGWGNWMQNLQVAPPLPAPPGFTGVALAGLGALDLIDEETRR